MDKIKRIYFYLFYVLNNVFKQSADQYNEYKSVLVIVIVETILISQITDLLTDSVILDDYEWVKIRGVVLMIVISFINYRVFIDKKYWKCYEKNFSELGRVKKYTYNSLVFLFFVFFIWFCYVL